MSKFAKRIIFLIIIIGVLAVVWFFTPFLDFLGDFEGIFENRDVLRENLRGNYAISVLVFIAVYLAAVAFSIPGAAVLSLIGGFLYGPWLGMVYVNVGASLGALIIFLAARYFLGDGIQNKYGDKLAKFNGEIEENGASYMLTLRLIPIFPFFLVNLFAGVTSIKASQFLVTTSLGIIPGSLAYTWLGYAGATIGQGIPWQLLVAFGLLGVLSLIPVVLRKRKSDSNSGEQKSY